MITKTHVSNAPFRCKFSRISLIDPILVPSVLPGAWANFSGDGDNLRTGRKIALSGYLSTRRDVNKKLAFTILRNVGQSACIQLVSSSNNEGSPEAEAHAQLRTLREWTPVVIEGTLKERTPPPQSKTEIDIAGPQMMTKRELHVTSVHPLNEIPTNIIVKEEAEYGPEQRHLQLRTNMQLRQNLFSRKRAMAKARTILNRHHWSEIETPILFKSTPEGAREFLVPTRNKGLSYALPQSPQQYKQILMASGFTRYYQFARCFRDEDLRADRQPEFTQVSTNCNNDVPTLTLNSSIWRCHS